MRRALDRPEAHAEAARDFIMAELATKADLLATEQKLQASIETFKETLILRLTVRFGALMVVWVAAAAAILKPARHPASWLNCLF